MFTKLKIFKDAKLANRINKILIAKKDGKIINLPLSRTELKLCKNIACSNQKKNGSAYCGECKK